MARPELLIRHTATKVNGRKIAVRAARIRICDVSIVVARTARVIDMFVSDISCGRRVLLAPGNCATSRDSPYVVFHVRSCVLQLLKPALEDD